MRPVIKRSVSILWFAVAGCADDITRPHPSGGVDASLVVHPAFLSEVASCRPPSINGVGLRWDTTIGLRGPASASVTSLRTLFFDQTHGFQLPVQVVCPSRCVVFKLGTNRIAGGRQVTIPLDTVLETCLPDERTRQTAYAVAILVTVTDETGAVFGATAGPVPVKFAE